MFETVAPEVFRKRSHAVFYQTLPISITVHALAVGVSLAIVTAQVEFPQQSPPLVRSYALVEPPPPPPPPPPPAPKHVVPTVAHMAVRVPTQIVAPTVIPDAVRPVTDDPPPVEVPSAPPVNSAAVGEGTGGVEGGTGTGPLPPPPPPPPDDHRLHVALGVPLPMHAVRQEYPQYPEEAHSRGYEDNLRVRYVIGKDGRVKDITVIDPPYRKMFLDAVERAMHYWRFNPYIGPDGQPQEVVHELSFNFQLN